MAKYYGQRQMDAHIETYFPKGYIGNTIEVGATGGIRWSNTYYFEQMGWLCLCIEPNPYYLKSLAKNRQHVLPYACGAENRNNVQFTVVTLKGDNQSAVSSLNVDKRLLDKHKHLIHHQHTIQIKVRTLDTCIAEFNRFETLDFVSVDTEGTELEVLKGFDIARWTPKLLVIENNYKDSAVEKYLLKFGYQLHTRHYKNDFYYRNDSDGRA